MNGVVDHPVQSVAERREVVRPLHLSLLEAFRSFLARDQLFAGLFILAYANGMARRVFVAAESGWLDGLGRTFDVSVIVWAACFAAITLLLRADTADEIRPADTLVGSMTLLLTALPFGPPNWFALTALSLYVLYNSQSGSTRRRGALILLVVTVPMYWGPTVVFDLLSRPITQIDALVVSGLIGAERIGNLVKFIDESGYILIEPACSSFANMSLGIVAWVTVTQLVERRWSPSDFLWCALVTLSVFAVNVGRLSLIVLYRDHFDTIHGAIGAAVAGWLSLVLMLVICFFGVRREIFARA
jgi:exosortase/archaeosortase family protein